MNHGIIPYIGGKHRIARQLVEICAATGAETFVDVFGGSAAVTLAAVEKFKKVIYNDVDGDLVNLFRVISDDSQRLKLFRIIRDLPCSRRIFEEDGIKYVNGGFSFSNCQDPIERARRTLYRHLFAFGGKTRSGGFCVSLNDKFGIKEVHRYRNTLRKLAIVARNFQRTMIENKHFQDIIIRYGGRRNVVLFCDPPYEGTEAYYSRSFNLGDHEFLALALGSCEAKVVCTYYSTGLIKSLYPADLWQWQTIQSTRNSQFIFGNKANTDECIITKK
ncbi:MAG: DNA adenine methylase [Candidatus Omnitrophica bacterium]|nr:DNA adenine methylase [Candidatus Omnitrophota bacterium]MDE2215511.1 DNA adenine methylase [Candidatus Omnitrophota bacterium]